MSIQTASPFRNASRGLACWTLLATLSPFALFPICELGVPSFPHRERQEDLPPMGQLNAESQGLGTCVSHTSQYSTRLQRKAVGGRVCRGAQTSTFHKWSGWERWEQAAGPRVHVPGGQM